MGLFDFLKKNASEKVTDVFNMPVSASDLPDDVLPVEQRIKNMAPLHSGLYPHEVLLLSYAPKYRCDGQNNYQQFWKYSYGVSDVDQLLWSLEQRGFITIGDAFSAAQTMTIKDLKPILQRYGLSQSGKKDELLQRLVGSLSADQLNKEFPIRYYALTDKGNAAIAEEPQILYIHRHQMLELDIWSLTKLVHTEPYTSYRDKIWRHLNQCALDHAYDGNFGLYRNTRFNMSEFVAEEGKYTKAITLLFEVVQYDMSWLCNNYDPSMESYYAKNYFEDKNPLMAPGVMERIAKYQDLLGWSDTTLRNEMLDAFQRVKLPVNVLTPEECVEIYFDARDDHPRKLAAVYSNAEIRYYRTHKR